jgi:hypothetical protein
MLNVIMLSVAFNFCYGECHYAECRYAECCCAECRYAECRGPGSGLTPKHWTRLVRLAGEQTVRLVCPLRRRRRRKRSKTLTAGGRGGRSGRGQFRRPAPTPVRRSAQQTSYLSTPVTLK